jgi:muramoyltetrapeptide carboxypeptidase
VLGWQDHVVPHRDGNVAVLSPVVLPGDRVRLVSPASYPDREWLAALVEILEGWGLVAEVADHAMDQHGFMAGVDAARVGDLNDAFRDPGVRAVVTTRGGAGAYRIADDIDFDAVRADPKPLVGFSDITFLHLALWKHCRLTSVHGSLAGVDAAASVRQLLMTTQPLTVRQDPDALSARVHVPGRATGPLVGGNLTAVAGSVGVCLEPLDGAILFLETPRGMGLGLVDRQLTQIIRSGALDHVAGVVLGLFSGFDDYTDRGWDVVDVLQDRLEMLGVPLLGGVRAGHGDPRSEVGTDQFGLALGAVALLDADAGTLTVGPCVR